MTPVFLGATFLYKTMPILAYKPLVTQSKYINETKTEDLLQ